MSAKKRALGRGLDALLGSGPQLGTIIHPAGSPSLIENLDINHLVSNPYQPRKSMDQDSLEELAQSIEKQGILQPLVVRQVDGQYQIVAGERRWRAAARAGLETVPVIVREFNDQEMLELALIENIQREALNAVEEAEAYRQLVEEFALTQDQVAERVGKSRVAVTNSLRLLRLPRTILNWVEDRSLSAGHARALLPIENEETQLAVSREIMTAELSVRAAERRVRQILEGSPATAKTSEKLKKPNEIVDLEDQIRVHLGLRVKIRAKSNISGKVEVYYSSLDEFNHFIQQINLSLD
jgi:ParB family chromosome partitioning protein